MGSLAKGAQQADLPPAYQQTLSGLRLDVLKATEDGLAADFTWRNHRRLTLAKAILAAGRPELSAWRPPPPPAPPPVQSIPSPYQEPQP